MFSSPHKETIATCCVACMGGGLIVAIAIYVGVWECLMFPSFSTAINYVCIIIQLNFIKYMDTFDALNISI